MWPMKSLIAAVARALEAGDPLGALNRVALRDDAAAPALRGIAMVQYGFPERDSDERKVRIGLRRTICDSVTVRLSRRRCHRGPIRGGLGESQRVRQT